MPFFARSPCSEPLRARVSAPTVVGVYHTGAVLSRGLRPATRRYAPLTARPRYGARAIKPWAAAGVARVAAWVARVALGLLRDDEWGV